MIPALQVICTEGSICIETTENTGINKSRKREVSSLPESLKESLGFMKEKQIYLSQLICDGIKKIWNLCRFSENPRNN